METGTIADDQATLEDLELVIDAKPAEFELGGRVWRIRQPSPAEFTRIRLFRDIAERAAWADIRAANLSAEDVQGMIAKATRIGYWSAKRETSQDDDERKEIAKRIAELKDDDPTNAYQEVADAYANAERDRRALEMLLECDDDAERAEFLANAGACEAARPQLWRVLILANSAPNWNGRRA